MGRAAVFLAAFICLLGSFVHASKDSAVSPIPFSSSNIHNKSYKWPFAAPPKEIFNRLSPTNRSSVKVSSPVIPHTPHKAMKPLDNSPTLPVPFPKPPARKQVRNPAPAPAHSSSFHWHHARKRSSGPGSAPSHLFPPPSYHRGPVIFLAPSYPPTALRKKSRHRRHSPPPLDQGPSLSPIQSPFSPETGRRATAPSSSVTVPFHSIKGPIHSPMISPSGSSTRKQRKPVRSLPPAPPNQDCSSVPCTEPLTNTLPGSSCGCVWPMQVGLRLSVDLYTFFPLVSELAQEIAAGLLLNQSQVRIMGANAASQEPDKTVVLIDLVPLGDKFNNATAFLAYEKFWHKKVALKAPFFGDYEVLNVQYPGLPPSPPTAPTDVTIEDRQPFNYKKPRMVQPRGVDITKRKSRLDGGLIAIIALSSAIVLVLCVGAVWLLLWKCGLHTSQPTPSPRTLLPLGKLSGAGPGSMLFGSGPSSASLSFSSSIATYTGCAKTFSLGEIEKATYNFDASGILGEGGFGRVYRGNLEDGTKVAVKVLKRDDHQGGQEFLAEVEMLSRLHHRNLVKLIGICMEEHSRCLVYELIPNGSVESHLHGADKETALLDWNARMKIALGSARGLAYLHEDSSPHVIHRDFKSSNVLLEYDFTPKVSDFGLAITALDGGSEHISTRVMGTFGYVAPEYAMTGHLLVKSDVYSYGVVLLELLTGRKPVDMSQPPGQENLVNWARPLLTSKEGLEMIIDSALGSDFPFDSVAKVAAIASMCIQPEVSHRPFMGEVVQALQLVCNECDEKKGCSESCSQQDSLARDTEAGISNGSGLLSEYRSFLTADYDSGLEAERALSTSDIFDTSARFTRHESRSFSRHSTSGPLTTNRNGQHWLRDLLRGSVSEHGVVPKSWPGMQKRQRWL